MTDYHLLLPALAAGIIVLATHVPLGAQVLSRGIVFIDLAIAQIAGLGVITADLWGFEPEGIAVQVSAVSAALLGALVLNLTEKWIPKAQEALIGILFVLAATGGVILLSNNPHGGEHLKDLLVGQILWVSFRQLIPAFLMTLAVMTIWGAKRGNLNSLLFYILFSVVVTASVQLVGVYLVFSSLIIPAVATVNYSPRTRLLAAYSVGLAGYLAGLWLSADLDLPAGAVIVWTMALAGILAYNSARFITKNEKPSPTVEVR